MKAQLSTLVALSSFFIGGTACAEKAHSMNRVAETDDSFLGVTVGLFNLYGLIGGYHVNEHLAFIAEGYADHFNIFASPEVSSDGTFVERYGQFSVGARLVPMAGTFFVDTQALVRRVDSWAVGLAEVNGRLREERANVSDWAFGVEFGIGNRWEIIEGLSLGVNYLSLGMAMHSTQVTHINGYESTPALDRALESDIDSGIRRTIIFRLPRLTAEVHF